MIGYDSVGGAATDLRGRLPALLAELRRTSGEGTLERRLLPLLERLRRLLPSRSPPALDVDRLASILSELTIALAQGPRAQQTMNPWTVAGAKRREVRNAAILAALWSSAQVGDVAVTFLAGFLARCGGRSGRELPTADELALGYRVRVENCPGADGADRVDLVIETARHLIGVEVKIDARESPGQLARYVDAIARNARQLGKRGSVIFLAPLEPSRDDVFTASWSTVRAAAAASLSRRRADYDFAHHLVAQFARHVRSF